MLFKFVQCTSCMYWFEHHPYLQNVANVTLNTNCYAECKLCFEALAMFHRFVINNAGPASQWEYWKLNTFYRGLRTRRNRVVPGFIDCGPRFNLDNMETLLKKVLKDFRDFAPQDEQEFERETQRVMGIRLEVPAMAPAGDEYQFCVVDPVTIDLGPPPTESTAHAHRAGATSSSHPLRRSISRYLSPTRTRPPSPGLWTQPRKAPRPPTPTPSPPPPRVPTSPYRRPRVSSPRAAPKSRTRTRSIFRSITRRTSSGPDIHVGTGSKNTSSGARPYRGVDYSYVSSRFVGREDSDQNDEDEVTPDDSASDFGSHSGRGRDRSRSYSRPRYPSRPGYRAATVVEEPSRPTTTKAESRTSVRAATPKPDGSHNYYESRTGPPNTPEGLGQLDNGFPRPRPPTPGKAHTIISSSSPPLYRSSRPHPPSSVSGRGPFLLGGRPEIHRKPVRRSSSSAARAPSPSSSSIVSTRIFQDSALPSSPFDSGAGRLLLPPGSTRPSKYASGGDIRGSSSAGPSGSATAAATATAATAASAAAGGGGNSHADIFAKSTYHPTRSAPTPKATPTSSSTSTYTLASTRESSRSRSSSSVRPDPQQNPALAWALMQYRLRQAELEEKRRKAKEKDEKRAKTQAKMTRDAHRTSTRARKDVIERKVSKREKREIDKKRERNKSNGDKERRDMRGKARPKDMMRYVGERPVEKRRMVVPEDGRKWWDGILSRGKTADPEMGRAKETVFSKRYGSESESEVVSGSWSRSPSKGSWLLGHSGSTSSSSRSRVGVGGGGRDMSRSVTGSKGRPARNRTVDWVGRSRSAGRSVVSSASRGRSPTKKLTVGRSASELWRGTTPARPRARTPRSTRAGPGVMGVVANTGKLFFGKSSKKSKSGKAKKKRKS